VRDIPELASVIWLAGALQSWEGSAGSPVDPLDDGYLTAADIRHLDMHGTEVVTMWSCETGHGLPADGDLYGFRSAFLSAGAGTVIAPAWDVQERETALLAEAFYTQLREHAGGGQGTPTEAWWQAVRAWLAAHPAPDPLNQPYYWAAFLPTGG